MRGRFRRRRCDGKVARTRRKQYLPDYARDSGFFLCAAFLGLCVSRGQTVTDNSVRVLLMAADGVYALSFLGRLVGTVLNICSAASAARLSRLCSVFTLLPEAAFLAWLTAFLLHQNTIPLNRLCVLVWLNYFAVGCGVAVRRGIVDLVRSRKAKPDNLLRR